MRRYGYILERIIDMDNLSRAAKLACSTRKNKTEVAEFLANADINLTVLRDSVLDGTYSSSQYRMFHIHENGKKRFIADLPLYPDRILHWAICLITEPLINKTLIDQTYASIPGRGYHQTVRQV